MRFVRSPFRSILLTFLRRIVGELGRRGSVGFPSPALPGAVQRVSGTHAPDSQPWPPLVRSWARGPLGSPV